MTDSRPRRQAEEADAPETSAEGRLKVAAAFLEHSKRNGRFDECVLRDLRRVG